MGIIDLLLGLPAAVAVGALDTTVTTVDAATDIGVRAVGDVVETVDGTLDVLGIGGIFG